MTFNLIAWRLAAQAHLYTASSLNVIHQTHSLMSVDTVKIDD